MSQSEKSVCDKRVFNELFDLNSEPLRNYLYYQCGDIQQAEDLVQEAFIKLWKNCKKVLLEKARGFLFTVAKNAFYNQVEHQKVVLKYAKRSKKNSNTETPEFQLEEKEFMERLQNAIADLPEGQREVFLLNRMDQMTYKEIAEFLGVSQKAVEKRMHKALVKLRKTVKNI
ncbi:RNA polymerase sigma factor [Ulvibacterium sp.]|uniref:RNA polymerase sigma factor n=1 Tax=Ulvibacterium sp. TaxID=2665914 RepID=UPI002614AD52|nr:RNA polymerase sigma factor [Ulvibacterium sp.]